MEINLNEFDSLDLARLAIAQRQDDLVKVNDPYDFTCIARWTVDNRLVCDADTDTCHLETPDKLFYALSRCHQLQELHIVARGLKDEHLRLLLVDIPPTLKKLNLARNKITNWGVESLFQKAPPQLEDLVLSDNPISSIPRIPTLTRLCVDNCPIDAFGVAALPPRLVRLSACEKAVSSDCAVKLAPLLQKLPLERLELEGAKLEDRGVAALAQGLPRLTLTWLDVTNCSFRRDGFKKLGQALRYCLQLKVLRVCHNRIGAVELAGCLPGGLEGIHMAGCHLGPLEMGILAAGMPAGLRRIDFSCNPLGSEGGKLLADSLLQRCSQLEELDLELCEMGSYGFDALSRALTKCPRLKKLRLIENEFMGFQGAQALSNVPFPDLLELYVSCNRIGPQGVLCLARGLSARAPKLATLDIANNSFDSFDVTAFIQKVRALLSLLGANCKGTPSLHLQERDGDHAVMRRVTSYLV